MALLLGTVGGVILGLGVCGWSLMLADWCDEDLNDEE